MNEVGVALLSAPRIAQLPSHETHVGRPFSHRLLRNRFVEKLRRNSTATGVDVK